VAHARDHVLLGFPWGREIGVVLEPVGRGVEAPSVTRRALTRGEAKALHAVHGLPREERPRALLERCTCKEAYLKRSGINLGLRPSEVEAGCGVQQGPRSFSRPEAGEAAGWHLFSVDVGAKLVAAMALAQGPEADDRYTERD